MGNPHVVVLWFSERDPSMAVYGLTLNRVDAPQRMPLSTFLRAYEPV